jgi:hypothetical protein
VDFIGKPHTARTFHQLSCTTGELEINAGYQIFQFQSAVLQQLSLMELWLTVEGYL